MGLSYFKTFIKQKTLFLTKQGFQKTLGFIRIGEAKATNRACEHVAPIKKRTPTCIGWGSIKKGDDILSHITAVPSAQAGLTTLFGMGRGEPRRNNHLKRL